MLSVENLYSNSNGCVVVRGNKLLISLKDMKTAFGRVITLMLNKTFQIMIRFTDSVPMIRKSMFGNEDFVAMNLTIFNLMEPIRNDFWCLIQFL